MEPSSASRVISGTCSATDSWEGCSAAVATGTSGVVSVAAISSGMVSCSIFAQPVSSIAAAAATLKIRHLFMFFSPVFKGNGHALMR